MKKKFALVRNYTGNAALCAILVMIMLLAIGTAVLVVTDTKEMELDKNVPAATQIEDSSLADNNSTAPVEEKPQTLVTYPEKGMEFVRTDFDSFASKYAALIDVNNKVYSGVNMNKRAYPASLTKIMTVIIALENCDDLNDTYRFTTEDIKSLYATDASVAGFKAGERVKIQDLLYGAMLPSGADATLGLANYTAGSEKKFVELMNKKVKELGLKNTHFVNASGLHDKNHYSSAMDIALIVQYALNNDEIRDDFIKIISPKDHNTDATNKHKSGIMLNSLFFKHHNEYFVDRDEDGKEDAKTIGGKTGYTDEAGFSEAAVYQIEDTYYICVTMKAPDADRAAVDNVMVAERYLPTYDLIKDILDSSSTDDTSSVDSGTVLDSSGAVDATPKPIDQTDREDSNADVSIPEVIPPTDDSQSTDTAADAVY